MLRATIHAIIGFLFRLLSRLDVKGVENIPASGAAILVANHLGGWIRRYFSAWWSASMSPPGSGEIPE